jgi:hypothetical protein
MSQSIRGTLVEIYLRNRAIKAVHDAGALRFHPRCEVRPTPPLQCNRFVLHDLHGGSN